MFSSSEIIYFKTCHYSLCFITGPRYPVSTYTPPLTTFISISQLFIASILTFSLQDASFAQIRMFARGVFRGQKESSKSMSEMQTQEMQSTYSWSSSWRPVYTDKKHLFSAFMPFTSGVVAQELSYSAIASYLLLPNVLIQRSVWWYESMPSLQIRWRDMLVWKA